MKYNYLTAQSLKNGQFEKKFVEALKTFQVLVGLPPTGQITKDTLQQMTNPRCGRPDIDIAPKRKRRYKLHGTYWGKRALKYAFKSYTPDLPKWIIRWMIRNAMQLWMDISNISFQESSLENADIVISFVYGNHGDPLSFDGSGGVFAHAFYPYEFDVPIGGDIHFDDAENWSVNFWSSESTTDLFSVAVHEIGHSLGLLHSTDPRSIMFPMYKGYIAIDRLPYDDILGTTALYGKPEIKLVDTKTIQNYFGNDIQSTEPRNENDWNKRHDVFPSLVPPDPCVHKWDAVMYGPHRNILVFMNDHLLRLAHAGDSVLDLYPSVLEFPEVPGKISAATHTQYGLTYFFKGNLYWQYKGTRLLAGPMKLPDDIKLDDNEVDAALSWKQFIYLFSKDRYWRVNARTLRPVRGYPVKIKHGWKGVPDNIDSAFVWKHKWIYFFKGKFSYKYNPKKRYGKGRPKMISRYWMKC